MHYLNISHTAFCLAGGIILLLVALDMLTNKQQARREQEDDPISTNDKKVIFPLAIPLLAGPAAFTSVMVAASNPAGNLNIVIRYSAMVTVALATAIVLIITSLAEF